MKAFFDKLKMLARYDIKLFKLIYACIALLLIVITLFFSTKIERNDYDVYETLGVERGPYREEPPVRIKDGKTYIYSYVGNIVSLNVLGNKGIVVFYNMSAVRNPNDVMPYLDGDGPDKFTVDKELNEVRFIDVSNIMYFGNKITDAL